MVSMPEAEEVKDPTRGKSVTFRDQTLHAVCFVIIRALSVSCQCILTSMAGQPPVVARIVLVHAKP